MRGRWSASANGPSQTGAEAASAGRSLTVLIPGELATRTGGYGYDRRVMQGLAESGWHVDHRALDGSYPFPTPAAAAQTARVLSSLPDQALVLADGLAFGAMPEAAEAHGGRLRLVALVHHPLASETGLREAQSHLLFESERRALACARAIVVTSAATVGSLAPYGIAADEITVIEPGTDPRPQSPGSGGPGVQMLCVASVSPRKGHATLVDALSRLRHLNWRLTCVGDMQRDPGTVAALRAQIAAMGLGDRVELAGERSEAEVSAYSLEADLFVLPTFHEGYGMAVAEALAHGLPVVSTPTGAIAHLVGDSSGVLVPPGDASQLATVLAQVIADDRYRAGLAAGARARRALLPTWTDAVGAMARLLSSVGSDRGQTGV